MAWIECMGLHNNSIVNKYAYDANLILLFQGVNEVLGTWRGIYYHILIIKTHDLIGKMQAGSCLAL